MAIVWERYGPCIRESRVVLTEGVLLNGEPFGHVEEELYVAVEVWDDDDPDVLLATGEADVSDGDNWKAVARVLAADLISGLG